MNMAADAGALLPDLPGLRKDGSPRGPAEYAGRVADGLSGARSPAGMLFWVTNWVTMTTDGAGHRWTAVDRTPRSGPVSALVKHMLGLPGGQGVAGSNPVVPTDRKGLLVWLKAQINRPFRISRR
jgi:hypothetical protein